MGSEADRPSQSSQLIALGVGARTGATFEVITPKTKTLAHADDGACGGTTSHLAAFTPAHSYGKYNYNIKVCRAIAGVGNEGEPGRQKGGGATPGTGRGKLPN